MGGACCSFAHAFSLTEVMVLSYQLPFVQYTPVLQGGPPSGVHNFNMNCKQAMLSPKHIILSGAAPAGKAASLCALHSGVERLHWERQDLSTGAHGTDTACCVLCRPLGMMVRLH